MKGRDQTETNSDLMIGRNVSNDPYLRDQYTNAYKQDTGNQYRVDNRTNSESTTNMRRLEVSEDLTIQLNFKADKSSVESKSTQGTKMDKQVQVRHGEHVEINSVDKRQRVRGYNMNKDKR